MMHRNSKKITPPHKRQSSMYSIPKENIEGIQSLSTKQSKKKHFAEASNLTHVYENHGSLECDEIIEEIVYSSFWKCENKEYFYSLEENLVKYLPKSNYFSELQVNLNPYMRAILIDWMIEVCAEFTLKRETFYMAVSHLDRFLTCFGPIQKNEFQLVGLVSMYLASKIEEIFPPKLEDWVKSADDGYSNNAIKGMELFMLRNIHWNLYPPTPFNYINWLMTQWDSFINYHFSCVLYNQLVDFKNLQCEEKAKQTKLYEKRMIFFKAPNQQAYKRFRETIQVLDVSSLEINFFLPKHAAGGLLYLMVSKFFFESNYELLYYNGPEFERKNLEHSNVYFDENGKEVNAVDFNLEGSSHVQELFSEFIASAFEIQNIDEIYEAVKYFHPLMDVEIDYSLPVVCKTKSKSNLERHYGEFLTFQTHSAKNLEFVTRRLKK